LFTDRAVGLPGSRPPHDDGDVTTDPAHMPRLTVAAAARRLGVAPDTLRTWARRYGIGPNEHTPGRHRRYSPDDIARLELMRRALVRGVSPGEAARYALAVPVAEAGDVPTLPPDTPTGNDHAPTGGRGLRLPGARRRTRGLGRAALALDAAAVTGVLAESVDDCGVETTWDEVVCPVLTAVGERWDHTGGGVEIEHLITECVSGVLGAVLSRGTVSRTARDARPVLLTAMPDELHTLPILALAAALSARGLPLRYLGANLPRDGIAAAALRTAPAAVVLWSQRTQTADVDLLCALPRTRFRYDAFAAGPGWDGADVPRPHTRLTSLHGALAAVSDAVTV
jgi:MerR family transcriptional regulator, light-induced transcriptional regulator